MWFLILWFLVGLFSLLSVWILDLRNKTEEYVKYYFDGTEMTLTALLMIILGFFAPIVTLIAVLKDNEYFMKIVYKIANIGIKKEK